MLSADFVIATAVGLCRPAVPHRLFRRPPRPQRTRAAFLRSPFVYTLAISVYCTSWTFYGAVGSAARNGLEYLTIYLGPTLVFVGWWFVLRRLVRISHNQRITSVADLLSSRFGKSSRLAVLVTVIAVIGIAPYIALQLKAVTSSIQAVAGASEFGRGSLAGVDDVGLALGVAAAMALFTILFGTRNVDAKEQHHGVVAAIAFEAVVKLAALLAVGHLRRLCRRRLRGDLSARRGAGHRHLLDRDVRQPLDRHERAVGRGDHLPAAAVPGHGGRELRREPPAHRELGLPGLHAADEPLHPADRAVRADHDAGRARTPTCSR